MAQQYNITSEDVKKLIEDVEHTQALIDYLKDYYEESDESKKEKKNAKKKATKKAAKKMAHVCDNEDAKVILNVKRWLKEADQSASLIFREISKLQKLIDKSECDIKDDELNSMFSMMKESSSPTGT